MNKRIHKAIATGREALAHHDRRKLLSGAAVAFSIKILSAALSYFMFVALARAMTLEAFGVFGAAFSLGLFGAKVAVCGQQQLVMREVSAHPDDAALKRGVTLHGYAVVLVASAVLGLMLTFASSLSHNAIYSLVALFVPVMAISELQTSLLRGHGSIALALAPREVAWRVAVIAVAGSLALTGSQIEANWALVLVAGLLAGAIVAQMLAHPSSRLWTFIGQPKKILDWRKTSASFWGSSVILGSAQQLSTVIVGLILMPTAAGPFFAALKTAQLLNLLLLSSNIIAAPLLSRYYGRGDLKEMQIAATLVATIAGSFAIGGLLVMIFYGDALLAVFGSGFVDAHAALIVMATGYTVSAACGPNAEALDMTGNERIMLRILTTTNGVALLALPVATWAFGTMGAAAVVAGSMMTWNLWARHETKRQLGIDTSLLSLITLFSTRRIFAREHT
ncbi:lipopolysaccharide biosynthesis protein [Thiocystis violacea]|uniref:lipopolysaccharide biosynthesis protein n=1 Tax=Thiocystis violacea TaxID=13725 RepID=UPI0019065ED6|nr:lipopolysaccharide biosynthesis protein [Thiocystis violacea]MBK1720334.1 hypothetical protein [Thiocystis violacea]